MENFVHSFLLVLPLMLLLIAGYIMAKRKFLAASDQTTLSKLLFWIITPAMLFRNAFHVDNTGLTGRNTILFCVTVIAAALITVIVAWVMERVSVRIREGNSGKNKDNGREHIALAVAASIRPNTVYVGLPTVLAVWGDVGLAPLSIYLAIATPVYNILSPLSIEILMTENQGQETGTSKQGWRAFAKNALNNTLHNPIVMSALSGVILFSFGVSLPGSVDKALAMTGNAATVLALFLVGASMVPQEEFNEGAVSTEADVVRRAVHAFTSCWRDVLMRLFIHPAILYLCLTLAGITGLLRDVSVLVTATPTAVAFFVLAKGLHIGEERAGKVTVMTTLLSVIAMPLWIMFLN